MADRSTSFINYDRLYRFRFRNVDQQARTDVWKVISRYLYDVMGRPDSVLDPAAGRCEFINSIPAIDRWAVDAVDHGFCDPRVTAIYSDLADVELPPHHFGGVLVSNFLEHLPSQEQVAGVLGQLYDAVEPGGAVVVMGPNFRYTVRTYFDCADHILALTDVAIAEHLYAAGFEVERVIPRFIPFSFAGRLPPSAAMTSWYLRLPILWKVLGKQFLVIGRKPLMPET